MVNPGGLEPPAAGLKVPCPADPGFTLGVRSDPAFERCHRLLLVWCTREVLPLLSDGYRPPPSLLRLTCLGYEWVIWCSVEDSNPGCRCVGPMPLAAWRTERGSGGGIRTRTVTSFEEADSADWSTPPSVYWYAGRDSNAHILRSERSDSCLLVYRRMVPAPRNRTRDLLLTRQLLCR
jgi:hypothetical protein